MWARRHSYCAFRFAPCLTHSRASEERLLTLPQQDRFEEKTDMLGDLDDVRYYHVLLFCCPVALHHADPPLLTTSLLFQDQQRGFSLSGWL